VPFWCFAPAVEFNFGLVKIASAPCAVKVRPFGFLAKTFLFLIESFVHGRW
jgi:hypothetical protein